MEDEVQLQSLAKRLINIYNACKWSKTKLHLRKKKRIPRNTQENQHFEEYTEVETESSARTVFVYNRNNKNKTEKNPNIVQSTVLEQYGEENSEIQNQITDNIQEPYCNNQTINVCTCKKCCCAPGKLGPTNEAVNVRKSFANKKQSNSKLIICLTPPDKHEAPVLTKNIVRGCCCPVCAPQNYGSNPPIKKKSSIRAPKPAPILNRDYVSQSELQRPSSTQPPARTSQHIGSYYAPIVPLPSKSSKATKETNCPASAPKKKCCECSPNSQCTPPKPLNNSCCKCPPSLSYSGPKTSECCQCNPSLLPAASFGIQCIPLASICCCDKLPSENNHCCCQSDATNNTTVVCTDKIIIPTCYFNEREQPTPSGNLSLAVSEEVKNVLLDVNSTEQQKYDTSDKQINTEAVLNVHVPVASTSKVSSTPQSINDCKHRNCQCHQKELNDRMINTSCVVIRSCTHSVVKPEPEGHLAINPSHKKCDGICCKCQYGHHDRPPVHSSSPLIQQGHRVHSPDRLVHSANSPKPSGHHVQPLGSHASNSPKHPGHHIHSPSPPIHPEHHIHSPSLLVHPPIHAEHHARSPSPPIHPEHHIHSPSLLVHPPIHPEHHVRSPTPPIHPEHHIHSPSPLVYPPIHHDYPRRSPGDYHGPPTHSGHPANPLTGHSPSPIMHHSSPEQNVELPLAAGRPPYDGSIYPSSGEERMVAKHSPQPFSTQMYPSYGAHMAHPPPGQVNPGHTNNNLSPPLYKGMVLSRQTDYTANLLRSQSTPLCCKQVEKGEGDQKIAGINVDTEAEIYATLQKIETSLRDEADCHSRNMRCIVDQVCKQAGEIKELKVLVTGVVQEKRAPSCKDVGKKIKKLEKRKEKEGAEKREHDLKERERMKREGKRGSVEEVPSNLCCKCGVKKIRPIGCCGKCCAKRCRGCCGKCCKGCCPKFCNCCCAPFEKCCPTCCCGFAKCCDACWSCSCCPRRKKKCKCSK